MDVNAYNFHILQSIYRRIRYIFSRGGGGAKGVSLLSPVIDQIMKIFGCFKDFLKKKTFCTRNFRKENVEISNIVLSRKLIILVEKEI